jgi:geranylgeranyl pyrophosphate synthase
MLGNSTPQQQEALWDYGLNIGMAFQIVDDLLDFHRAMKRRSATPDRRRPARGQD